MQCVVQSICLIAISVFMITGCSGISECINISIMPAVGTSQLTFHRNANGFRILTLKDNPHSYTVNLTGTTAATQVVFNNYRRYTINNSTMQSWSTMPRITVIGATYTDIIVSDSVVVVPVSAANFTFGGSGNAVTLGPFKNSEPVRPVYGNDGRLTVNACIASS